MKVVSEVRGGEGEGMSKFSCQNLEDALTQADLIIVVPSLVYHEIVRLAKIIGCHMCIFVNRRALGDKRQIIYPLRKKKDPKFFVVSKRLLHFFPFKSEDIFVFLAKIYSYEIDFFHLPQILFSIPPTFYYFKYHNLFSKFSTKLYY